MAALTDNLVALWEFREQTGSTSVADLSGNGKTLTLTNGSVVTTGFGRFQGSLFDGTDDYGTSTAGAVLRSGATNDLTIAAWLRFNIDGRNDFINWKTADGLDDVSLYINGTNNAECWCGIDGVAATVAVTTTVLTSGSNWYHVGVTKSGNTWQMYLSGVADGGAGTAARTLANHGTDTFWIGSNHDASFLPLAANDLDGKLAQVGVWNRALSAAEFSQLYNSGAGLVYPFTPPAGVIGRFGFGFDFGF